MAINPPTDIVHDVARAADPMRYQAAASRLSQFAASNAEGFDDVFKATMAPALSMPSDPYAARTAFRNETALSGDKSKTAYQQLEAFVLQSFIETMLPKDAEASFGKGTAGNVWRSMMAEQIGTQISKAGGVGIAKILASHPPSSTNETAKLSTD